MREVKFRSFSDIDHELEILKIEKEIKYEKMMQTVQQTREDYTPGKLLGIVPKLALDLAGGLSGGLKGMAISFVLKKLFK